MNTKYEELKNAFKNNDVVYINTWSKDCDGFIAIGNMEFTSYDEFCKWENNKAEWADGPFGWVLTTKEYLTDSYSW